MLVKLDSSEAEYVDKNIIPRALAILSKIYSEAYHIRALKTCVTWSEFAFHYY